MNEKHLEGLRVAILATNGVQETELAEPRKALEDAGARTTLIALKLGTVQASIHGKKGKEFSVDATFGSVNSADFDAVLLPGGLGFGRVRSLGQKRYGRNEHPADAVSALHRVFFQKCELNRMECAAGGESFDGENALPDSVLNIHHAGRNGPAVGQYVTRSTNTLTTAEPSACQAKIVTKHHQQRSALWHVCVVRPAIHIQMEAHPKNSFIRLGRYR
jgi:hypothetical protein